MWWSSVLALWKSCCRRVRAEQQPARRRSPSARLNVEALEDRTVPALLAPVTTPAVEVVVAGDFNGDGRADLAVSDGSTGYQIRLLRGNGDGTFQTRATGVVGYPEAVGDFNGDGRLDLVARSADSSSLILLRGNGDGSFQSATLSTPMPGKQKGVAGAVEVGDMNNDGHLDLVVGGIVGRTSSRHGSKVAGGPSGGGFDVYINVFLGQGDGSFRRSDTEAGYGPALGDFNRDGRTDVLVGPVLLLGNGDGTLKPPASIANGGGDVAGDFNGDGILDLLRSYNPSDDDPNTYVFLSLGNGDATFQPSFLAFTVPGDTFLPVVGDFNGDGRLDVVTSNSGTFDVPRREVRVLLSNGDGSFQPAQTYAAGTIVRGALTADFNGDGRLDLAALGGNNVSVLLNDGTW